MDSQAEEAEVGDGQGQGIDKVPGLGDGDAQPIEEAPVNNAALENMDGDLTNVENDFDDSLLNDNDPSKDEENKDEEIDEDRLLNDEGEAVSGEAAENAAETGEVLEADKLLDEPVENEMALKEGEGNKEADGEQDHVKEGEKVAQDDDALLDAENTETDQNKTEGKNYCILPNKGTGHASKIRSNFVRL